MREGRMDWKAHLFFGVLSGAAFAHSFLKLHGPDFAFYVAVCGACALLPDLDMRKSKASKALYALAAAAILMGVFSWASANVKGWQETLLAIFLLGASFLALDFLFRPRHRGFMHGLLFLAAICAIAYALFGWLWASALFIGYLSHLLADFCLKLR